MGNVGESEITVTYNFNKWCEDSPIDKVTGKIVELGHAIDELNEHTDGPDIEADISFNVIDASENE